MNKIKTKINNKLIQKSINLRDKTLNNEINNLINKIDYYILDEIKYRLKYTEYNNLVCIIINSNKKILNIECLNDNLCIYDIISREKVITDLDISKIYNKFFKTFEKYIQDFCNTYNFELDVHVISDELLYYIKLKENNNEN